MGYESMGMKIKFEIDLINVLKHIRDIPKHSTGSCHSDHRQMSEELDCLISQLKLKERSAK